MAKTRNSSFDIVKGIGIILVVLAHSVSQAMGDSEVLNWVFLALYNLALLPMMFVSGYFSVKLITKPYPRTQLLKQRTVRLMTPYCVWAVIYLIMKAVMSEHVRFTDEYKWYTFFLGNNPDGQLWFLYVVFIASIILIFCSTEKNIALITAICMAVSFFALAIPNSIAFTSIALNRCLYEMGYFILGAYIAYKHDYKKIFINKISLIISLVVVAAYLVILYNSKRILWYTEMAGGLCYLCVMLNIAHLLSKTKLQNSLSFIGQKSMEIYLLHGPLLVVGRIILPKIVTTPYVYILVMVIYAVTVSLLLSFVINKIKIARLLLFGTK